MLLHSNEQQMTCTMTPPSTKHLGSLTFPLTGDTNDYHPLLDLITPPAAGGR